MPNNQVILLVGAARHSTNFVAGVLNFDNQYRDSVEPFRLRGEPGMFSFARWKYIPSANQDPELLRLATGILLGEVKTSVEGNSNASRSDNVLVQELRAHLWLGWLRANFPDVRIVLLFRHPLAVISTRLQLEWRTYLRQTLAQTELLADHLARFDSQIEGARTALERHTFMWCIQHYVPLRQFGRDEIHLAFFENIIDQPELELQRLCDFVGRPFDHHMSSAALRYLSSKGIGEAVTQAWRTHLNVDDLQRCRAILGLFGLDTIYGDRRIGSVPAAEAIMRN